MPGIKTIDFITICIRKRFINSTKRFRMSPNGALQDEFDFFRHSGRGSPTLGGRTVKNWLGPGCLTNEPTYRNSANLGTRHVPRSQKDPGYWIPRIHDPGSWGSLRILDLEDLGYGVFIFSWDLRDLRSCHSYVPWNPSDLGSRIEKILLDPGDPGSRLSRLSWDLADLGSYTTIMSLYFEHHLHPMEFCFWFPISMRCWNLSNVKNFNNTLIQPICADLKTISPCWFLHMLSIIDVLLRMWWKGKNARFSTS